MEKELNIAKELAMRAGDILLEHYARNTSVDWKGQNDPVTAADRAVSELLVRELKRLFPDDGILSEEARPAPARLSKSRVWIIDPMDGTREFIDHRVEFAVMIGLAIFGKASLGVIYQPISEKMYYAVSGMGAFLERCGVTTRLHVSPESDPALMTIALSRSHNSPQVDFIRDRLGIKGEIRSGSIGLKVGMICEGLAHLYLHTGKRTYQWDSCASEAILHEAGGLMTNVYGDPLRYNTSELRNLHGIIASNGQLHDRIVEVTKCVLAGFI
ncbi:MAG: 3'(2'),5'-bisphosphate nucleotidase CysQ [Acidobacteria bacterium]|nr:3'(2'),5'-bisphosphate nucleotidase CysQ [Acidobacteriota bacterium]